MSFLASTAGAVRARSAYTGPLRLWFFGFAVAVLGVSIWWSTRPAHITECGFDANGAYAKVHVNNLLGEQELWVDFLVDGRQYTYAGRYNVRGTTVLRAPFPRQGGYHVSGHTLSCKFDYTDPD